jgi:hypothetical protein
MGVEVTNPHQSYGSGTHQCDGCGTLLPPRSLEPPNRDKATSLAVKFLRRDHLCFRIGEFVNCGERGARCGEQQDPCQRRERQHLFIGGKGSTRLCCAYSPNTRWSFGDCFARQSPFSLRGNQAITRGRADTHHETTTQKRTWPRTKPSVSQLQSGAYELYSACRMRINGRKHLVSTRPSQMLHLGRHVCLNYWLGHICVCISV